MIRSHLLLLAAVALLVASTVGCGGSEATIEKKLIGKWELSKEDFRKAMNEGMAKKTGDDNEMGAALGKMMQEMVANMEMSMDFQPDGKLVASMNMMGQNKIEEGTWEIVSGSGNDVVLKTSVGEKQDETSKLTFIDDDTFELHAPEGQKKDTPTGPQKIVMKRVK